MNFYKILPAKQFFPIIFILVAFHLGCGNYIQETIVVLDNKVQELKKDNIYMPSDSIGQTYSDLKRKQSVFRFYKQRNFRTAWIEEKQLSIKGDSLISMIKDIRYYGLLPEDYHLKEITKENLKSEPDLLRLDALLTDAFLNVSNDLKYGRFSKLKKANDDANRISVLHQMIIGEANLKSTLRMNEPNYTGYHSLKESLKLILDELKNEDRSMIMNGALSKEELLNKKLQSIEINLERWRWENHAFGDRYIFINIPSYLLQVISRDSVILESQVLVGTPQTPTPAISSIIDCLVVFPYWHLPKKLIIDRYLPLIQKDSSFISLNNFDVLDKKGNLLDPKKIEWKKYNKKNFPFILRQREHPESSLGVLDLYYNEYPLYIFLHDANDRILFNKNNKALTDGSIKLEKAVELAHLLYNDNKVERTPLEKYLTLKKWKALDILNPIPVHIRYFTCEYKGDKFYQYEDIYGKDQQLIEVFYNKKYQTPVDLSNLSY